MLCFFFFNDTATTEIYTLSLHDALPILWSCPALTWVNVLAGGVAWPEPLLPQQAADRKSTRLNSSHMSISYAVFCLKKKKTSRSPSRHSDRARSVAGPRGRGPRRSPRAP